MAGSSSVTTVKVQRVAIRVFCLTAPAALVAAVLAVWQSAPTRGELGATALIIGIVGVISGVVSLAMIPPSTR